MPNTLNDQNHFAKIVSQNSVSKQIPGLSSVSKSFPNADHFSRSFGIQSPQSQKHHQSILSSSYHQNDRNELRAPYQQTAIKSIETSKSDGEFYKQILPKLTSIILNSRPTILSNDEDTMIRYRSPNANIVSPPTTLQSRPITNSLNSDPNLIQVLTDLKKKSNNDWLVNKVQSSSPNTKHSTSIPSPPQETYMTLSFESSKKDQSYQTPASSNGLSMNPLKMANYYKQIFPETETFETESSSYGDSKPRYNTMQSASAQTSSSRYHQPQSIGTQNFHNRPSMTLSYQPSSDHRQQNIVMATTQQDDQLDQDQEKNFDWRKSISHYAKEFGFEIPNYQNIELSSDDPPNHSVSAQQQQQQSSSLYLAAMSKPIQSETSSLSSPSSFDDRNRPQILNNFSTNMQTKSYNSLFNDDLSSFDLNRHVNDRIRYELLEDVPNRSNSTLSESLSNDDLQDLFSKFPDLQSLNF